MRTIKLLHIITGIDIGGAELLLLSTLKKINREKYDITVCYLKGRGELKKEFESSGIRTIYLGKNALSLFGKTVNLYKIIKREKFDIVHVHLIYATIVSRIAAKLASVRIIVSTEHNTSNWQRKYFPLTLAYRFTEKFTDKILAISEAVKKCIIEVGKINPQKIEVLYNGIDLSRFAPQESHQDLKMKLRLNNAYPIIGSIGRFDERKGHPYLIQAVAKLQSIFPNIKLLLVGDGKKRSELEALIKMLHLDEKVIFTGIQKNVVKYLSIFDVFVLPSIQEGFSISLVEAMAMKKSIIATSVGGIPEVVTDGKEGLLVPPRNVERLSEAIRFLIENKEKAEAMKAEARRKVEEKFDLDKLVVRLETIYEELMCK